MKLEEATKRLEEIMPQFIEAQEEYANLQDELLSKKSWWYRQEDNMALKNAEMREAHLQGYLEQEKISGRKLELGNNFYRLKAEKEFLMEISKSLRIIEGVK